MTTQQINVQFNFNISPLTAMTAIALGAPQQMKETAQAVAQFVRENAPSMETVQNTIQTTVDSGLQATADAWDSAAPVATELWDGISQSVIDILNRPIGGSVMGESEIGDTPQYRPVTVGEVLWVSLQSSVIAIGVLVIAVYAASHMAKKSHS